MKTTIVIGMALLATAAGLVRAAAQDSGPYYNVDAMDYPLHEAFPGNARVVYTANLPELTSLNLESLSGAVYTDGSGHVAGQVYARIYFGGPNNRLTDYAAYSIAVTGKNSDRNSGTNPQVKLNLHGEGYDFDGFSNHPNAMLTLKFTSTNTLVDVPALVITNGSVIRTNSAFTILSGKITGNLKPGKGSPINNGNQLNINEKAALVTAGSTWVIVNETNITERALSGGMVIDYLTNINAQVIQPRPGSKVLVTATVGSMGDLYYSKGTANYDGETWNATLSGVAFGKGSNLHVKGDLGPLIVAYEPTTNTNFPLGYIPRIVQNGIQNMTITSGKVFGQKVPKDLQGISVPATPPGSGGS
jgi:hypothetical protein